MFPVPHKFDQACPQTGCSLLHCPFDHSGVVPSRRKRNRVNETNHDILRQDRTVKAVKVVKEPKGSKLIPRQVYPNAPETIPQRLNYLRQLENHYRSKGHGTESSVEKAIETEFEIATSCSTKIAYNNKIKTLLYNLVKFGNEHGKPSQARNTHDMASLDDWLDRLFSVCIPRKRLERHGYPMQIPEAEKEDSSFLPSEPKAPGLKSCLRCNEEFMRSTQMKETTCCYHPGKQEVLKQAENSAASNDYNSRVFSCCNQTVGEARGCKVLKHHVFKHSTMKDMHEELPFVELPEHTSNSKALKAVGLDCEMGFTSCGFECIKISIVDYVTEKTILDKLVKPKGEIIDLNTHVSDVAEIPEDSLDLQQIQSLLREIFDSETVVVGHGLENDFNCLRLLPTQRIVDTAILYSESSLVRRKDSLKKLAWKYLSLNIQSGTHDSVEDCVIPIQIVKNRLGKRNSN
ncbi:unnamed protein product [Kuraishia capsulata CBS 1993]|uniref:RNA exonuclease 3 n=1 Tax=Kuraishia capsulata CBS 1993 TaxID=1382522 RepID=W6MR86_9ASCO|nr:uncharacterized protein KUCA_T00000326001 [Kuraishia capsulata CBS 1993]CDK24365.1 unnamed protein product [Kuraishia capsulata CBS 1993]